MNILSLHLGHDGSVTIIEGNEVVIHHQLDRFNKFKHEYMPSFELLEKIKNLNIKFDKVVITSMGSTLFPINYFLQKFYNIKAEDIIEFNQSEHHYFHAKCAQHIFNYPSNCFYYVSDGEGAEQPLKHDSKFINNKIICEAESIYDQNIQPYYKFYTTYEQLNIETDKIRIHPSLSNGKAYQRVTYELGLEEFEEGKTMALSSYGKYNSQVFQSLLYKDKWNTNILGKISGAFDSTNKYNRFLLSPIVNHLDKKSPSLDFVHTFQKTFEHMTKNNLKKIKAPYDKLILTGGCAQNILTNSELKNHLNCEILADPFNGDFGISLGSALHVAQSKINPIKHICSGFDIDKNLGIFNEFKIKKNISAHNVAKILQNEPIAIFSGKSEQGQRGLGFRSLLGNPLQEDILEKINKIKKREWYRPFACTVLKEKAHNFFDIKENESSPYMMFAYKSKNESLKNVCSVDGLSRIQTLEKNFHLDYYQLISEFEKLTNIPIVLNTSLNLPGHVLCEDYYDLYKIFKNSSLNYCWLSDEKKLICRK